MGDETRMKTKAPAPAPAPDKGKPTFESVWAAIDKLTDGLSKVSEEERRKTEAAQRKTERSLDELAAEQKEGWRRLEEGRRSLEESLKSVHEAQKKTEDSLNQAKGEFNRKWGRFMERLVEGDLKGVLAGRGILVDSVESRVPGICPGGFAREAEYDLVAHNGSGVVVVVEVKTTLLSRNVERFLDKLAKFRGHFPKHGARTVHGAIAFMKPGDDDQGGPALAEREGLLLIRAPGGDSGASVVVNPGGFEPREF